MALDNLDYNPYLVTVPDANWNTIDFNNEFVQGSKPYTVTITVRSGTGVRFSVGKQGDATKSPVYDPTNFPKLILKIQNDILLYYKGTTSDTFEIALSD